MRPPAEGAADEVDRAGAVTGGRARADPPPTLAGIQRGRVVNAKSASQEALKSEMRSLDRKNFKA